MEFDQFDNFEGVPWELVPGEEGIVIKPKVPVVSNGHKKPDWAQGKHRER